MGKSERYQGILPLDTQKSAVHSPVAHLGPMNQLPCTVSSQAESWLSQVSNHSVRVSFFANAVTISHSLGVSLGKVVAANTYLRITDGLEGHYTV